MWTPSKATTSTSGTARPDRTADGPEPKRQRTEKEDTATRVAALLKAIGVVDAYAKISGHDGGDTQQSAGEPEPRGGNTQQLVSVARDWVLEGALEALQTVHPLSAHTYTHTPIGLVQHLKSKHATALDLKQEGELSIEMMKATALRAMDLHIAELKADYETLYAAQEVQFEIVGILKPEAISSDGDQLVEDLERKREQYTKGIRTLNDQHNLCVEVLKGDLEKVEANIRQMKEYKSRREQQLLFARGQFTAYSEAASECKRTYLSEQKQLEEIASAFSPR